MRDPFANYDRWLEAPYQEMNAQGDDFVDWCETNNINLEDPKQVRAAEIAWEEYIYEAPEPEIDLDEDYERDGDRWECEYYE